MKITNVSLGRIADGHRLKALATITLDDCFVVNSLKVIEGRDGLFVAMPSRQGRDGRERDIAHPITKELRQQINKAVLDAYNEPAE